MIAFKLLIKLKIILKYKLNAFIETNFIPYLLGNFFINIEINPKVLKLGFVRY